MQVCVICMQRDLKIQGHQNAMIVHEIVIYNKNDRRKGKKTGLDMGLGVRKVQL